MRKTSILKHIIAGAVVVEALGLGIGNVSEHSLFGQAVGGAAVVHAAEDDGVDAGDENPDGQENQDGQNTEKDKDGKNQQDQKKNDQKKDQEKKKEETHPDGWTDEMTVGGTGYYKKNKLLKGWQTIDGRRYHFDKDGRVETGIKTIDGALYYLGEVDIDWATKKDRITKNETGFIKETTWRGGEIVKYYINSDLKMATGWCSVNGRTCLFGTDGVMKSGWNQNGSDWMYLSNDAEHYGAQTNCWYDGCWLDSSGRWTYKDKGSWSKDSWGWWYTDTSGWYPKSSWQKIDGDWYYFDEWGYIVRASWKDIGGAYYYFNFDGTLEYDAFDTKGEATGQWIDGYYINHAGVYTGRSAYWWWDGAGYQLWSSDDTWHAVNCTEIIDKERITFDANGYATYGGTRLTTVPPMGGSASATKNKVIQYAVRSLGFPYVYGGQTIAGTDCSGFTMLSYQSEGYILPHNAGMQYTAYASNEVWVSEVQPGDLLFYYTGDVQNDYGTGIGHVALYIGNGETLEAGDKTNGRRWYADCAVYVTK